MKRVKKPFCLALAVLAALPLLFASCTGEDAPPDIPAAAEPETLKLTADYNIVRGDNCEQYEKDAAVDFRARYEELTGVRTGIITDWDDSRVTDREIIIGKTTRQDSVFTIDLTPVEWGGFLIKTVGERLVITAGDSMGLTAALDYFFSLFAETDNAGGIEIDKEFEYMYNRTAGETAAYLKAMWLSQYDLQNVYKSGGVQRGREDFTKRIGTVLDNCASIGINTVIVQVRPDADSMYPSEYYPPSAYVTGGYGTDFTYDPFEIIVSECKKRGLAIHAWINPMRGMKAESVAVIDSKYQIRQWWDDPAKKRLYLPVVDGRVYLNPAYEEVRGLIVAGAAEIMEKYDVDGVHMDDYFYPTQAESFDSAAFASLGGGMTLSAFRKDALSKLVSKLYQTVHSAAEAALFGISPAGNINTVVDKQYADVYTWLAGVGYVDYICPQDYFGLEHQTWDFKKTAGKWKAAVKNPNIDIWLGITLGKAVNGSKNTGDSYAGTGKNEWIEHKDIIKRCLEFMDEGNDYAGVVFFCYQYFWDPVTGEENSYTAQERANFLPVLAVMGDD